MLLFHNTDRPAELHTREGLTEYLSTAPPVPEVLTERDYRSLSDSARSEYDRTRILYLSGSILLNTAQLQQAKVLLQKSFAANIGRNSGHAGLMISGDSTVGKTTTAKALMRYVFSQYARQIPEYQSLGHIPVVYVEVPAGSTGKLLMKTFARFLGLPVRSTETMLDIRERVVCALNAAHTQLIVVDELQNLASRNVGNGESVDILKNMHNDLAATFVYAGIDLTSGELFNGNRGRQISGRFNLVKMERLKRTNPDGRAAWKQLITGFEKNLPLRDHKLGTLPAMHEYLFDRTNGSIGSLGRLLTGAAIDIITDGGGRPELITREMLEEQVLDIAAEDFYATTKKTVGRRTLESVLAESLAS
ncbi:TniB family NTP-binding protein [Glaciibacter psychrotolerans]|uniref:AAA family ATPase n=1 Tax=Glaciibacter psychrotolerans TaxID=670054 RepID=A0A7Z0EHU6_9MICO|nr:TniB family NTP-binding protein [Leifsonia psychrotolerans]NYJ21119.1 hypothetical protein [Leifsonia psychrotolerans]